MPGILATRTPPAPIVAFMAAFPLTGPEELVLSGGLLGWPLDLIFFTGTITLGLAAGRVTDLLERPAGSRQARMRSAERPHNACPTPAHAADAVSATLARTISRWADEIVCAVLTGVTNARSESLNRIAKLEARMAYSFRNPANQRRRVRAASLAAPAERRTCL